MVPFFAVAKLSELNPLRRAGPHRWRGANRRRRVICARTQRL